MSDAVRFPLRLSAQAFSAEVERCAILLRQAADLEGLKVFVRADLMQLAVGLKDLISVASGGHEIIVEKWDEMVGSIPDNRVDIIERMGQAFVATETAGATDYDGNPITWENTGALRREHLRRCMEAVLKSIWPNWNGCAEINESVAVAAARVKIAEILRED